MSRFTRKNRDNFSEKDKIVTLKNGIQHKNNVKGGFGSVVIYSINVSASSNTDPSYKKIGIFHWSAVVPLSGSQGLITESFNDMGFSGFDTELYNECRDKIFDKIRNVLEENQKITDFKFDYINRIFKNTVYNYVSIK